MPRPALPLMFACMALLAGLASSQPPAGRLFGQTPAEFAARRAALRESAADALVLVTSPPETPDIDRWRYRTDNTFMYLTGVEVPNGALALFPGSGRRDVLFLPARSRFASIWADPVPGPDKETEQSTGLTTAELQTMWAALAPAVKEAPRILISGPTGDRARFTRNGSLIEQIRKIDSDVEIAPVDRLVHALRHVKSPGEVANLRAAIAATGAAQRAAARGIRAGETELAVEGLILAQFRRGGAVREGFPCIVGSGPNSLVLHHFAGERRMLPGETVVVDIGAEYNYYSADITRTYPVGGRFTPRQRALYQLVLDCQRACEAFIKPGQTTLGDLHRYAVGFLKSSRLRAKDSSGAEQTMDRFFVHGLSHWLGMDVHDVQDGSSLLKPGSVFTIEPGVYIASEGIGIRIEDDYLVTETGVEKLSRGIPSAVAEVEALMAPRTRS